MSEFLAFWFRHLTVRLRWTQGPPVYAGGPLCIGYSGSLPVPLQ